MARKVEIVLEKEIARKRMRNRVRLELAIAADRILNDLVPDFEEKFEASYAEGKSIELVGYDAWVVEEVAKRIVLNG